MALWIAILFLILFLVGMITITQKAQIEFKYWREGKEDSLTVILRGPFGLALYRAEMSLVDAMLTKSGPAFRFSLTRKDKLQGTDKQVSSPLSVKDLYKLKRLLEKFLPLTRVYRPLLECMARQTRLDKLVWKTQFGTSDAALTGICAGLAWSLEGWLMAFLQNRDGWLIKPENIEFVPVFDRTCFCTSFHCILSIRIAHVITAQLRWLKLKLRQRKR